jgi:hypothetical protein
MSRTDTTEEGTQRSTQREITARNYRPVAVLFLAKGVKIIYCPEDPAKGDHTDESKR